MLLTNYTTSAQGETWECEQGAVDDSFSDRGGSNIECGLPEHYTPDEFSSILTLRINFHFIYKSELDPENFMPDNDGGVFPNELYDYNGDLQSMTGHLWAQLITEKVNWFLENPESSNQPPGNNIPTLPTKIRVVNTGTYFHENSDLYSTSILSQLASNYLNDADNSIRCFYTNPLPNQNGNCSDWGGQAAGIGGANANNLIMKCDWRGNYGSVGGMMTNENASYQNAVNWRVHIGARMLLHEILHCFFLEHTQCNGVSTTCADTPTHAQINAALGYNCLPNPDCCDIGGSAPCCTNNIMGYNGGFSITPCQLGRVHYDAIVKKREYIEPDYCETQNQTMTIPNGANLVWNNARIIRGDLIISSGAILTVRCNIHMPQNARVIVEPGGKLIVDGGSFSNFCDLMWLGIEVWGNGNAAQIPSTNQGVVELKNGAVIENAHTGIWVRENDDECNFVQGTGGGIVWAKDSEIRNCYVGVEFAPYTWINTGGNPVANRSYFRNMTFVQTRPLNNDMLFKSHVIMNENYHVPFRGCRFLDEVPDNSEYQSYYPFGWKHMGIGIDARSSTFSVGRYCDGSATSGGGCNGTWIESEFSDLAYGIRAMDGTWTNSFSVLNTEFKDNVVGIYGSGMEIGPTIALNTFELRPVTINNISPWKVVGVVLEETEGYEVEENTFTGDTSQNPSGQQLVGAAFVHTGPVANECYKNTFNGVTVAAHAQGVNGVYDQPGTDFTGLQFRCNQFGQTADNELADIQVTDESRVAVSQGANFPNLVAGNLFSHLCPGGTGASDIVLGVNSVGNEYDMNYYYGATAVEEPICVSDGVIPISVDGGANACASALSFSLTKPQVAAVKSALMPILDDVVNLYNGLRDGGNPSGLVAYINNANYSSIEVRNEMMNCGPYISLAAWQAAFTRTPAMDPWHLAQVLFLNTPLHPDVKRMMDFYNFDPYYYELVLNGQNGGITHMQIMEGDISALTGEIRRAEQDYMRLAVLWEEDTTRWDEVMTFIGTDLHRQRLKAAIHIARGEYTQANNVLGGLPQNQNKGGALDILLAAEQADQFCPKFTAGQRNDLEYLAANEDAPGHSTARALLLQETGAEYDTELYFPMNPRHLMLKKPKADIPSLMRIHPNPTNDLVYISFKMPEGDIKAEIEITDSAGKTVRKEDVSQSRGLVELSLKGLGTGIYVSTLKFDGRVIESQKLTLAR